MNAIRSQDPTLLIAERDGAIAVDCQFDGLGARFDRKKGIPANFEGLFHGRSDNPRLCVEIVRWTGAEQYQSHDKASSKVGPWVVKVWHASIRDEQAKIGGGIVASWQRVGDIDSLVKSSEKPNKFLPFRASAAAIMGAMNSPPEQRFVLVTGGASGLGRAFCLHLASLGWHVAVVDVDQAGADTTLEGVCAQGGTGQVEILDVRDAQAWNALVVKLRAEWPRLDLLVNSAGICGAGQIGKSPLDDFRRILDVNLLGVVNGCHACVPWLLDKAPGGYVVNVASIAAVLNAPAMGAYSASKAGVIAFSETLFGELLSRGVGVTVVMPGFFRSRLLEEGAFTDEALRRIAETYSRKSSFTAQDVVLQTMRAVARHRLYVVLGRKARWAWRLKRWFPAFFQKVVVRLYERDRRKLGGEG